MSDLNTEVLIEIRDELRSTRRDLSERIDQTNARLDQTNARLDRLERRQTESEVRLATELVAVVGAVNQLRDAILEDRELRGTVLNHEQRIAALEAR
jgi:uncharacterized coiled-coil DUF342 family protein